MEEEPQLVLANKIVDNMVAVIKEVGTPVAALFGHTLPLWSLRKERFWF
jgi:hypothetical protein